MKKSGRVLIAVLCSLACACGGGGGGSSPDTATGWQKFRHDSSNSGLGGGTVGANSGQKQSVQIDDGGTPSAISSSPAITADDSTIYVASEAGTLAALPRTLGTPRWKVSSCGACPQGQQALGTLMSSPAVYTLTGQSDNELNEQTTIFIGSSNGSVFSFQDAGGSEVSCIGCFQPALGGGATVKFLSSPTFTTDPVVATVSGVFIGAQIDSPTGQSSGKLYALNRNGTLNWEFPRPGQPAIGAVTSSPAFGGGTTGLVASGSGATLLFTAADNYLYALASDGTLKWKSPVGNVVDPTVPLAISALTSATTVFAPTADGSILALNLDGSPLWTSVAATSGFAASLAAGDAAVVSPTTAATPAATPTPQPAVTGSATPTPTAAPTVAQQSFLYAVTKSGEVVRLNVRVPTPAVVPLSAAIASPVLSSPALSADTYLVFGSNDGTLHAINTSTGSEPSGWPVKLTNSPIRSSPAIATDGVIYVGADDGMLYAVGLE